MEMDKEKLLGIVTAKVLLPLTLRSLRKIWIFPVLQVLGFHSQKKSGKTALPLLTDIRGTIYLEPDNEVRKEYEIRRKADLVERESL